MYKGKKSTEEKGRNTTNFIEHQREKFISYFKRRVVLCG